MTDHDERQVTHEEEPTWLFRHRWHLLSIWIVAFTILTGYSLQQNRELAEDTREIATENT